MSGRDPQSPGASQYVIRPTVTVAIVYIGLCTIWFLWIFLTAKHPVIGSTEPWRLISTPQYVGLTVANALFLIAFAMDAAAARKGPPLLRRGHLAGLILSAVTVAGIQLSAFYAHGPLPMGD